MRSPRVTLNSLLLAVAIIAVDCYLVVKVFAGVLLPAITLNTGLIILLRRGGRRSRFSVGYVVTASLTLGLYVWLVAGEEGFLAHWPTTVYNFLVERLSTSDYAFIEPGLDRFWALQESPVGFVFLTIVLYESTVGFPIVLISTLGGWLWKGVGTRWVTHSGSVVISKSFCESGEL